MDGSWSRLAQTHSVLEFEVLLTKYVERSEVVFPIFRVTELTCTSFHGDLESHKNQQRLDNGQYGFPNLRNLKSCNHGNPFQPWNVFKHDHRAQLIRIDLLILVPKFTLYDMTAGINYE